jgi:trans-L-3-hydroxyproline dehydratase
MCGHGIIALTKVVFDCGIQEKSGDSSTLRIDTPAGRVTATAYHTGPTVDRVSFTNVPSFVSQTNQTVEVPGFGSVQFDLAFGGAFYAFCDASQFEIQLNAKKHDELIKIGRLVKKTVMENFEIIHPIEEDLGFLYGTILTGPPAESSHHSRNVCIFAEGEVDRSPTGTGVSARAAIHFSRGELSVGESITIESILGTCMDVRVMESTEVSGIPAVIPEVTGRAFITGRNEFYFDPKDPLVNGFIFR